jgi:hypothetical protein
MSNFITILCILPPFRENLNSTCLTIAPVQSPVCPPVDGFGDHTEPFDPGIHEDEVPNGLEMRRQEKYPTLGRRSPSGGTGERMDFEGQRGRAIHGLPPKPSIIPCGESPRTMPSARPR